jgi:hypothetical protein
LENALEYIMTFGKPAIKTLQFLLVHSYLNLPRDNVELLIRYVSNARHRSFPTFDKAVAYYLDAKRRNLVRIVRDCGDDDIYGPINAAVQ